MEFKMPPTAPKFSLSPSRMILLRTAIFIMLCVSQAVAESRRCYWCGPLAEQVHRSRRAPPCAASSSHRITVCEPGLDYCAVVATSPPYAESRYCVKLYQDECYPLFCNSTKTWKMTCPCRGDLCNGPNTEREIEAFVVLSKLVAKAHNSRIKKRTALWSMNTIISGKENQKASNNLMANDSLRNYLENIISEDNIITMEYNKTFQNSSANHKGDPIDSINNIITTAVMDKNNTEIHNNESNVSDEKVIDPDFQSDVEFNMNYAEDESKNIIIAQSNAFPTRYIEIEEAVKIKYNNENKIETTSEAIIVEVTTKHNVAVVSSSTIEVTVDNKPSTHHLKQNESIPTAETTHYNLSRIEKTENKARSIEKTNQTSKDTCCVGVTTKPTIMKPHKNNSTPLFNNVYIILSLIVFHNYI